MQLIKNNIYRSEIIDYSSDGSSIARIEGMAVFIPSGAVGDICDIKILKINSRMAFGKIEKIIQPSKNRQQPDCANSDKCGGCCFQHITYAEELRAKRKKVQDAMNRIGGFDIEVEKIVGSDNISSYRNKAQYPVGTGLKGEIVSGFYRKRSHDIVPIERCFIQNKKADIATAVVRKWMKQNHIMPYNELNGKGVVRHVYVRTGEISGQTQVCIVANAQQIKAKEDLIQKLLKEIPSMTSLILNINTKMSNEILGKQSVTLYGSDTLEDTLCGNKFLLSPHAFYQVNHAQAEKLYNCALDFADLSENERVLDLYCGAGTITLALSKKASHVIGVDVVPQAIENAKENAQNNSISNVEFICADAGQAAHMLVNRGEKLDVLVVDPPRKGLDELSINAALKIAPKKIVYVSCDCATLARDVKILCESDYKVERCVAFDLFPRTGHVESVVLLQRQ